MNNELVERVQLVVRRAIEKARTIDNATGYMSEAIATAVLAELAGELRDCERYRWLRSHESAHWTLEPTPIEEMSEVTLWEPQEHDTAIDEARHG